MKMSRGTPAKKPPPPVNDQGEEGITGKFAAFSLAES